MCAKMNCLKRQSTNVAVKHPSGHHIGVYCWCPPWPSLSPSLTPMPRGRPRTRTDMNAERTAIRIMDIRPKLMSAPIAPEPDIPIPSTLAAAPIFATLSTFSGSTSSTSMFGDAIKKSAPPPPPLPYNRTIIDFRPYQHRPSTGSKINNRQRRNKRQEFCASSTLPPLTTGQDDDAPSLLLMLDSERTESSPATSSPVQLPIGGCNNSNKPFICFYCGFQCDSHLMRHRCVPGRKRQQRQQQQRQRRQQGITMDGENCEQPQQSHYHGQSSSNLHDNGGGGGQGCAAMECEAAEVLSIMLRGA